MKVRNWHKRNTGAAGEISVLATVSNGGGHYLHVQLHLRSSEKGRFDITMTPEEAKNLIGQLQHCVSRYNEGPAAVESEQGNRACA